MASKPGAQMTNIINNQSGVLQVLDDIQLVGGKIKVFVENIVLASQATTDTIPVARLPLGACILGFLFVTDTSLGSSTVAIVDAAASPVTYAAAATFTATDTPTWKGKAAVLGQELALATDYLGNIGKYEDLILTIATAALPASGNFTVMTFYTDGAS